jgi:hypothetical protein
LNPVALWSLIITLQANTFDSPLFLQKKTFHQVPWEPDHGWIRFGFPAAHWLLVKVGSSVRPAPIHPRLGCELPWVLLLVARCRPDLFTFRFWLDFHQFWIFNSKKNGF